MRCLWVDRICPKPLGILIQQGYAGVPELNTGIEDVSMRLNGLKPLALLLLPLCNSANAGEIILKSELWDFICEVEVAIGPDTPDVILRIHELSGVRPGAEYVNGIVFTGEGRLCYRRSSIIDDCHSEMNDWVCYTNYSDEPEIISIY